VTTRQRPAEEGNQNMAVAARYHLTMRVATGTVVAGKVVVDGVDLPEGANVTVLTPEPDEQIQLTADEEAGLLDAIAEVERGDAISSEELFARLDRIAKL
jgi:hypothetical protein